MGIGYKNLNKVKQKLISMDSQLKKTETDMRNLRSALATMMKGDADGPYWNGEAAQAFFSKGCSNCNGNIADYNDAYQKFNTLATEYENQVASNRAKKGK